MIESSPSFVPPEFRNYHDWMEKKGYSHDTMRNHMQNVKRIGYVLLNGDKKPKDIAALVTNKPRMMAMLAQTVENYRGFVAEKPRRENQIATLMTISEKVVASSHREERMSMRDEVLV